MEARPWEQQPGEPALWYSRFHAFLLLGPTRSERATYEAERASKGGKQRRGCSIPGRWPAVIREWRWHERAKAWDAHNRAEEERQDKAIRDAKRREWAEQTMSRAEALALLSEQARTAESEHVRLKALVFLAGQDDGEEDGAAAMSAFYDEQVR